MMERHPSIHPSKQTDRPTYVPGGGVIGLNLAAPDEVPDTGHPVCQEGECGHEQREDHGAVLGVTIQLLQEAKKPKETHRLQQVDPKVLGKG